MEGAHGVVRPVVRELGRVGFLPTFEAMRRFSEARTPETPDEIWLCEHPPVYTLGVAGRVAHVRQPGDIPVVPSNRGGQVTYHGPGQVVAYALIDLHRLGIFVKEFVFRLEQAVLQVLASHGVTGIRVPTAPGIYVRLDDPFGHTVPAAGAGSDEFAGLGKIAALGVKVSRGHAYHGVALNVAMDLGPFGGIDPCGYPGLRVVDLATLGVPAQPLAVAQQLGQRLGVLMSR